MEVLVKSRLPAFVATPAISAAPGLLYYDVEYGFDRGGYEGVARVTTKTQTRIVVEATAARVAELEEEYERRAGQPVPSPQILRID